MSILQQLVAQILVLTMSVGGISCLCPAEAAGVSPVVQVDADHGHDHQHGSNGPGDVDTTGCGHENCGSDCTRVSATAAKAKGMIASKATPSADDLEMPALAPVVPASISSPVRRQSAPPARQKFLQQDSPVRRFDRLLD